MKWLDEIMGRKRWTSSDGILADVGLLTVIHDTFKNDCRITAAQGDAIFGPGWQTRIERLRTSGVLHVEHRNVKYHLSVNCRSDERRAKVAEAQKKHRMKATNSKKEPRK